MSCRALMKMKNKRRKLENVFYRMNAHDRVDSRKPIATICTITRSFHWFVKNVHGIKCERLICNISRMSRTYSGS